MDDKDTFEPTIHRTKISIINKTKTKRKRTTNPDTLPKRITIEPSKNNEVSQSDITLIHRGDGLLKDEIVLKNTLNTNINNGPNYVCHFCNSSFFSGLKLKMHFLLTHSIMYCKICDLLIESVEEKFEHENRVHSMKMCEICQEEVKGDYIEHYDELHDAIVCRYCDVILIPKKHYGKHLVEKHCSVASFVEAGDIDHMIQVSEDGLFFCNLCDKKRNREIFGHYSFHHKINLYYLADLFIKQNIDLRLNIVEDIDDYEGAPPQKNKFNYCRVCKDVYLKNVPKSFHKVYCQGKYACIYCPKIFEKDDELKEHIGDKHNVFSCKLNCNSFEYKSLEGLNTHYLSDHDLITCNLCDELIPDYKPHVALTHKILEPASDYDELLKLNDEEVFCILCRKVLTDIVDNAKDMLNHFKCTHRMSTNMILRLIGEKPITFKKSDESESDVDLAEFDYQTDFDPKFIKCLFEIKQLQSKDEAMERKCFLCNAGEMTFLNLICHLFDKHNFKIPEEIIKCATCKTEGRNFMLINHMQHYFDSLNEDVATYKCIKCYFAMPLEDARVHILEKHKEDLNLFDVQICGLKCRFCNEVYWERLDLETHEMQEHFSQENRKMFLECYDCHSNFCSAVTFSTHRCNENVFNDIIFQCRICEVIYPTVETIRKHFNNIHPKMTITFCPAKNCDKAFAMKKLVKQHYSIHKRKEIKPSCYECDLCDRTFSTKKSYVLHANNTHAKGFKCVICGDRFNSSEHRKHHYKTVHPGELFYECSECQKTFLSKSALHIHNKTHNEFSSICSYCGKEFFRRDSFKEHLLIHIGPKHQCTYCPRTFTQKSNLKRHIRLHTGEKPYKCPHCPKKFSDKGACNSHVTVHTRDQECHCEICGKKFSKQQKLKYHMKRHTGEGLVRCEVCLKGFTSQYDLRKHAQTHDQQTQIICECGRGFSTEKYLRTHIKVVHNPNKSSPQPKRVSKFNCYQCLICKNIYSLRTTVLKHLRNIHNINKKDYAKNLRQLQPEEASQFTPTVLGKITEPTESVNLVKQEPCETIVKEEDASEMELETFEEDLAVKEENVINVGKPRKQRNRKHKNPSRVCVKAEIDDRVY